MTWTDLIRAVAEEAGVSQRAARDVLTAFTRVVTRALVSGERVVIPELFVADSRWNQARTLRSVSDLRKIRLDGRYIPRFRAAAALKRALAERTPQRWRDPDHQAAWRVAETLLGDLALYHGAQAPALSPDTPPDDVHAACEQSFGGLWDRVRHAYAARVSPDIRENTDYLAVTARTRFTHRSQDLEAK